MLELGRMNTLRVTEIDDDGAWLQAEGEQILLPRCELTDDVRLGQKMTVFVYCAMSGEPVATLREPKALLGEFALLEVAQVNAHGAFMDWGLDKDLLVPNNEQLEPMKRGRSYLVKVRLDRQGRPIGSCRIEKGLSSADASLVDGQEVDLLVWRFTPLGAKVIVNQRFDGLLYRDEIGSRLNYADSVKGYVRQIRADGKIDCTLSMAPRDGIEDARTRILNALNAHHGFLPLHDKSPAEAVQEELGLSKKLFKKGLGGLYKDGLVELSEQGVRLKDCD